MRPPQATLDNDVNFFISDQTIFTCGKCKNTFNIRKVLLDIIMIIIIYFIIIII